MTDDLKKILDIGTRLAAQRNADELLELCTSAVRDITGGADCVIHIFKDADCNYQDSGECNNHGTVTVPMIDDDGTTMGIMQINPHAGSDKGDGVVYTAKDMHILEFIASITAISLDNIANLEDINRQIWSFTEAMTEAIDARTPYNASHTRKVAEYVGLMVDEINASHMRGEDQTFFDEEHKEQLVMAALLHDIGKMIVPIEVMNKSTRMENHLRDIDNRLEKITFMAEIDYLKGNISQDDYEKISGMTKRTLEIVKAVEHIEYIDDNLLANINEILDYTYNSPDGRICIPFLTEEEKTCMQVRRGTLTAKEREIMEQHVVLTERILNKVYFNESFRMTPVWAGQHHELIDGTGYPKGIKGNELGLEARILAVADICDALLATDRPYKNPMPLNEAFTLMESMAAEGKLEGRLVKYLKNALSIDREN